MLVTIREFLKDTTTADVQPQKRRMEKWIHIFSLSIVIIPTCLLCQMQANSLWAEFLRTIFKFGKRKKI